MVTISTPWTVQLSKWSYGPPDRYGEREKVYSEPVTRSVYGWAPPDLAEEIFSANRDAIVQDLDVYDPDDSVYAPDDHVIINGTTYRVMGDTRNYDHGPFGFMPGGVVRVKRVTEQG